MDVQIEECEGLLVEGPRTSGRVGCEAHHNECEHSRCGTAPGGVETNAAVHPTSTSRRGSRIPAAARDGCPDARAVGRCQARVGGGTSIQKHLQARRFRPQLRGRVAGVRNDLPTEQASTRALRMQGLHISFLIRPRWTHQNVTV